MTMIAAATATSTAAPEGFFARWADMATWPEWNQDTEWVRLDGPFAQGATGTLKPKGGPKVKFEVTKLTDTEFIDVSKLIGAKLTFAHRITTGDVTTIEVRVSIDGPLGWFWTKIMGADLAKSVQPDLAALIATVEGVRA